MLTSLASYGGLSLEEQASVIAGLVLKAYTSEDPIREITRLALKLAADRNRGHRAAN